MIYLFAFSLLGAVLIVLGPLIPIKATNGGLLETDYSIVFTLRGIGYAFGSFVVARLEKRYKAHHMIAIASLTMGILCIINVSQTSIFLNAIEWCLIGITCGFV